MKSCTKISVVIRKAYGGGNMAMGGHKEHGMDFVFSWPTGELAIMGAEQAAALLYRKEIHDADAPDELLRQKVDEYRERFANPYYYASSMNVDDVIAPEETRWRVISGLNILDGKVRSRKEFRHGNIPL